MILMEVSSICRSSECLHFTFEYKVFISIPSTMQKNMYVLVFFLFTSVYSTNVEKYTSKFNSVDLNVAVRNERLVNAHFNCLMKGLKCTPDGELLRRIIPEVIVDGCAHCTKDHLEGARKIVSYLTRERPELMRALLKKFDPDMKFRIKWAAFLKEQGFTTYDFR
ncbi:allergen Tha p 1-like [Coccinella septempunctata]|uniref:allergen Tha p 1-like n=1 Tax=Coccinella septempunctata TaxID=41139 RepID=UPI001D06A793|nr:allergen Tha p 1-like [Coccinella septempunctata]